MKKEEFVNQTVNIINDFCETNHILDIQQDMFIVKITMADIKHSLGTTRVPNSLMDKIVDGFCREEYQHLIEKVSLDNSVIKLTVMPLNLRKFYTLSDLNFLNNNKRRKNE